MNAASAATSTRLAGKVQAPDRREHRRRVVSLQLGLLGVLQPFAQEAFVHEHPPPVGERHGVPREAREVGAHAL